MLCKDDLLGPVMHSYRYTGYKIQNCRKIIWFFGGHVHVILYQGLLAPVSDVQRLSKLSESMTFAVYTRCDFSLYGYETRMLRISSRDYRDFCTFLSPGCSNILASIRTNCAIVSRQYLQGSCVEPYFLILGRDTKHRIQKYLLDED